MLTMRSSGVARSRNDGAAARVVADSRAARTRRRRRSRCRAGGSARGSPPARRASIVQPVGLFGELMSSARVPGRSASSSRSRSSAKPVRRGRERHALDAGAEDLRNLGEVRPQRRDDDDAIARADQRLHREHQRRHARRRDRDALGVDRPVQSGRRSAAMRLAQRRDAEVLRVERLAARERRAAPAARMNAGVTSSGSPNQNGSTSGSPMPALATSRIWRGASARTAARATGGRWAEECVGHGMSKRVIGARRRDRSYTARSRRLQAARDYPPFTTSLHALTLGTSFRSSSAPSRSWRAAPSAAPPASRCAARSRSTASAGALVTLFVAMFVATIAWALGASLLRFAAPIR